MLRKRIIFTLIYNDGFFNQSRNFRLQKVGDIKWLEKNYKFQKIAFSLDELIILNASQNKENINDFAKTLNTLVDDVFIPIAAGGGIRKIEDAKLLFDNGADKLVINTILHENKEFVRELVQTYGSQSLIACIDYKKINDEFIIYINNGTTRIEVDFDKYINDIISLGVGELYVNSIDKDGTGFGYDLSVLDRLENITLPLIIAGGAGNEKHLINGLELENVNAVATANLFNFVGNGLPLARKKIKNLNINIANW